MKTTISRRGVLAGLLGSAAGMAWAEAPVTSLRPPVRRQLAGPVEPVAEPATPGPISDTRPPTRPDTAAMIAEAALGGTVAFVIADAQTGVVLDAVAGGDKLPPASVTKSVTALYALEALGGDHRFATRLVATGPVEAGVVQGDLVLLGGGTRS